MRNAEKDEMEMAARRDAMLAAGFRLFAEKGIEPVPMQEVANACGVGVATLYRYYNTKLELVIDIGTRQWEDYAVFARGRREEAGADGMSAAAELEFFLGFYMDLLHNHKDLLRFNQNFNNFVRHEGATPDQLRPYLESISELGRMFHGIYAKGKQDGTIDTTLPEAKMFVAICHIMLAVGVRFAQGVLYFASGETDPEDEYEMLSQMILRHYVTDRSGQKE